MDWTEARLEAIRTTEEEEDEDEEREKDRSSSRQTVAVVPAATVAVRGSNAHASASAPASPKVAVKKSVPPRQKDIVCHSLVSDTLAHGYDETRLLQQLTPRECI